MPGALRMRAVMIECDRVRPRTYGKPRKQSDGLPAHLPPQITRFRPSAGQPDKRHASLLTEVVPSSVKERPALKMCRWVI